MAPKTDTQASNPNRTPLRPRPREWPPRTQGSGPASLPREPTAESLERETQMRNRALWAEISDIVDKEGRAAERRSQMASQNGDTIEKTTDHEVAPTPINDEGSVEKTHSDEESPMPANDSTTGEMAAVDVKSTAKKIGAAVGSRGARAGISHKENCAMGCGRKRPASGELACGECRSESQARNAAKIATTGDLSGPAVVIPQGGLKGLNALSSANPTALSTTPDGGPEEGRQSASRLGERKAAAAAIEGFRILHGNDNYAAISNACNWIPDEMEGMEYDDLWLSGSRARAVQSRDDRQMGRPQIQRRSHSPSNREEAGCGTSDPSTAVAEQSVADSKSVPIVRVMVPCNDCDKAGLFAEDHTLEQCTYLSKTARRKANYAFDGMVENERMKLARAAAERGERVSFTSEDEPLTVQKLVAAHVQWTSITHQQTVRTELPGAAITRSKPSPAANPLHQPEQNHGECGATMRTELQDFARRKGILDELEAARKLLGRLVRHRHKALARGYRLHASNSNIAWLEERIVELSVPDE